MVKQVKAYFMGNFEQTFVLIILISMVVINYFLPYKIAFLNFYYLPILAAGYFLGKKASATGSLLCILVVVIFFLLSPRSFYLENNTINLALNLATWGSFLLLAGIIVGTLHEKLAEEYEHASQLNDELQKSHEELEKANLNLTESNRLLAEKATELEEKTRTIEMLKDKVENTLYSTMDSSVAKLIIQGRLRNEKKSISVLFSDLMGFTAFSDENKPETVIEKLNKYLEMMEPVIENYRGHIDKYTGDGIMCEFGAPIDYDTHCLLAVLSGIKMQEKLRGADVPWLMRIGIGSGETITGLIGSKRQTYTAIGDVVNVASRLEEICPPGAVLIDEQTYHKVKNVIDVERLRSFSRKRDDDRAQMELIKANEEFLKANPLDVDKLLETGRLYFDLREVSEAIEYFEKALSLDPDNKDIKLIYADASLKKDQYEKIEIKGKKSRIAVYEVLGIKNIMRDRNRIPEGFYQKYSYVEGLIEVPDDVILPIEALDGTIGHSKIVAVISYAIANFLGLSEREKKNILIAGYLEDIGKQIIPHHILNRRGGLSETEIQEVEKHPVESTKILRSMGFDTEEILEIVAHHHEMYNGEGYPFGKKGQEIPLGARITSVADSYNALISWRPYREGWEQHAALAEMKNSEKRGKFDPQISEILINLMSQ